MSHRSTHYWLWFLLFGVIAGIITFTKNHHLDSESLWLLISGALGLILGAKWLNEGKFSRPYDLIIGIIFIVVGVVGILIGFGLNVLSKSPASLGSLITSTAILGLSLSLFPALIHTVLGLTSLNHGLKTK